MRAYRMRYNSIFNGLAGISDVALLMEPMVYIQSILCDMYIIYLNNNEQ